MKPMKCAIIFALTLICSLCIGVNVGISIGILWERLSRPEMECDQVVMDKNIEEVCIGGKLYQTSYKTIVPKLTEDDKQIACRGKKK